MPDDKVKKIKRTLEGIVVSDKNDKTVVVRVDRVKMHSKYHKRFTVSKRYKAHDAKNEYKVGDRVLIQECRPLSKDKRWRIVGRVGKVKIAEEVVDEKLKEVTEGEEILGVEKKGEGVREVDTSNNSNKLE
ncbi:30S ribosomal protein S17 [Patescibacteria group bacterium]|nr:30S ribosomal protein S17 [Patescibacteria group bacterium]MBU4512666.1 30S ribosomal protein S17 [Patescibacteria group bacterium]